MSSWFACAQFPLDLDLTMVDQVLTERDITHRFTEEQGYQFLWLLNEQDRSAVVALLEQWREHGLSSENADFARRGEGSIWDALWFAMVSAPASFIAIVLGLIGAGYSYYSFQYNTQLIDLVSFFPIVIDDSKAYFLSAQEAVLSGQVWRLITPTFAHSGLLHITFNALMIWVFGSRIERILGTSAFLILFCFCAVASNVAQGWFYPPGLFGGLSGVVYGLLGFIIVWQYRLPESILKIPPGVTVFMLVWLVLGFVGGIELLFGTSIANGAHLGGLISGLLAGWYATHKVLTNTKT